MGGIDSPITMNLGDKFKRNCNLKPKLTLSCREQHLLILITVSGEAS